MKVLGKYVLIDPIPDKEEVTTSGFIMSGIDVSKNRYQEANVVMPGVDVNCVKENDLIAFDSSSGHNIKIEGKFYRMILERDIAIII